MRLLFALGATLGLLFTIGWGTLAVSLLGSTKTDFGVLVALTPLGLGAIFLAACLIGLTITDGIKALDKRLARIQDALAAVRVPPIDASASVQADPADIDHAGMYFDSRSRQWKPK